MSINIEDLEDLGICKLGHQKRLMLGIKKAKLSRRRTTNFEEQGGQSISRSQLEGTKSKLDSPPSPRFHLCSLSVAVPLNPPPLPSSRPPPSERKKAFTPNPRPPPCSPKPTPGRPSSKPPAPPVASCQRVFQSSAAAFGKADSLRLQTTSKSHFEDFFEKDLCENLENKARRCQRTSGEGQGIVSATNRGISGSDGVKPAGLRVSQPVLWSSTLGLKQGRRKASVVRSDNFESAGSHEISSLKRDMKATQAANQTHSVTVLVGKAGKADGTEKKEGGSSKRFWNPIGKASKLSAPKIKEEPKKNLRALVQNYGDWIKERGMVELHCTPKPEESSSGWDDQMPLEDKMQPHKISQDTAFGNPCRYESEAWKNPPKDTIGKNSRSHATFSCDNSTEESLLTPYSEHQHQNGLRLFQRLRDTTRPLSWVTPQQPCSPASPSPPPYPGEEGEEVADEGSHLKASPANEGGHLKASPPRPARPVARVAALHVVTNQTSLQSLPSSPSKQTDYD